MFNLREAGSNRAILSDTQTAPTKTLSTWRPAERPDGTEDTADTSVRVFPSQRQWSRGLEISAVSFQQMIGFEDFDVALGGHGDEDDVGDEGEVDIEAL